MHSDTKCLGHAISNRGFLSERNQFQAHDAHFPCTVKKTQDTSENLFSYPVNTPVLSPLLLPFNSCFSGYLDDAACRFTRFPSFSTCSRREPLGINGTGFFYGWVILSATQPFAWKQWREYKALTLISGLASSFLHLPLNSQQKRYYVMYRVNKHPTSCHFLLVHAT